MPRFGLTRMAVVVSLAVVTAAAGGGFYLLLPGDDNFAACRSSAIMSGEGAIGGEFELLDANGELVTDKDVFTRPSLVYFGFTSCPGVCPVDNARNADAVVLLEEMGIEVTPVFISVDPERDTIETVARYVGYFHPRMIGLTGSHEQVTQAADRYRVYFKPQPPRDDGFYMVDHTTLTYLVLPDHGYADFFARSDTPADVAEQVSCFAREAGYA